MTSTSTFSFFSSVFGSVVAAISLLAFISNIFRSRLPCNRIKVLESLLEETGVCIQNAIEEGLLTELAFVQRTQRRLTILGMQTYSLRSRAYGATTLHKAYIELLSGISSSIGRTCDALKKLKGEVMQTSSEGRRSLMDIDFASRFSSSQPIMSFNFEPERRPIRRPFVVPRPHSCPAVLMETYLESEEVADPFCNPTLSDPDVRLADVQNCTSTIHTSVTAEC